MTRLIFTAEAADQPERQIRYLADRSPSAADRLQQRIISFLGNHLASFPRTGRPISAGPLMETWVPGTKLVVWYRFSETELTIISVWHTGQDRG